MNKFMLLSSLLASFLFFTTSCSFPEKPDEKSPTNEVAASEDGPSRAYLASLPYLDDYLRAYSDLNALQKYNLWQDKLNHNLTLGYTGIKQAYISSMRTEIQVSQFEHPDSELENERYMRAVEIFDDADAVYRLFMVLHDFGSTLPPMKPLPPGGGIPDCTCYYSISCGLLGLCDDGIICRPASGCGMFGTTNCDGRCDTSLSPK